MIDFAQIEEPTPPKFFIEKMGREIKFLFLFALLVLIPFLIFRLSLFSVLSNKEIYQKEQEQKTLEQKLSDVLHKIDPPNFLEKFSKDFHREVCGKKISPQTIENCWKLWSIDRKLNFDLYYFDSSGTLITPPSISIKNRGLFQRVWEALRKNKPTEDFSLQNETYCLWGTNFNSFKEETSSGTLFPIFGNQGNGFVFWDLGPEKLLDGGILAFWEYPSPLAILELILKDFGEKDISLVSIDGENNIKVHRGSPEIGLFSSNFSEIKKGDLSKLQENEWLWVSNQIYNVHLFAGKHFQTLQYKTFRHFIDAIFLLLVFYLWLFLRRYFFKKEGTFISIRLKLSFIFLYMTLISITGLISLGFSHLHEREEVLSANALKAGQEVLTQIDLSFQAEKENSLKLFQRYRDDPDLVNNIPRMREKALEFGRKKLLNWLEFRDINSKIIFTIEEPEVTKQIGLFASVISKKCIEVFLQDRVPPAKETRPNPAEVIVQNVFESPITGWGRILNRPNMIHEVRFGKFDLFWYWDFYADPNHPAALIQGDQNLAVLTLWYLQNTLKKRFNYEEGAFRVFAWDQFHNKIFPEGTDFPKDIQRMLQKIRMTKEPIFDKITWNKQAFLAAGIPGQQLKNFSLLALYPNDEILKPIFKIKTTIYAGILVAILLSFLLGWVLSDAFLEPIAELSRGVKALHERDPSVRIKVLKKDELGDLAQSFNQTMEEIKELLYAQTVQSKLIPQFPIDIPGFQMDLINLTATDLGGDYCDAVKLDSGKVLFVIGDVTGHGVSSALVMAMAKLGVFTFSKGNRPLVFLMESLNRLFCRLLKRKKLMTFFSAILEPETGMLTFSNAGHPFPILIKSDGEAVKLGEGHPPLGFSERHPFDIEETFLKSGDVLVFYTDGILEMKDKKNQWLGSKNFTEFLIGKRDKNATEIKESIVELARDYKGDEPLEDDITLLILKRV